MRRPHLRRAAVVLLVALSPLALDGCVSIGVSRADLAAPPEPWAPPRGAVTVAVYETPADHEADRHVAFPVLSELVREDKGETLVGRSMSPTWTAPDLPPGRYRLRVTKRIDAKGDVVALDHPGDAAFDVIAGERTAISVVLRKVPVLLIVVAALTVVALVVLAIIGIHKGDLPKPPPPPLLPLPPVTIVIPLGPGAGEGGPGAPVPAPAAVDVFPAPGSVVAARRITVTFLLSMPLAADGIADGAVLAVGTSSGDIGGTAAFDAEDQLLAFTPARDFVPGEDVTVTLDLGKLRGERGRTGSGRFSTTFKVAP
ncbi:MAG TPA: hypothetical protein VMN04_09090 [Thermoanaerobaculia bacterium]|nr:hypothetical protein [Thermoanaerobaculia bacterium]